MVQFKGIFSLYGGTFYIACLLEVLGLMEAYYLTEQPIYRDVLLIEAHST